MKKTGRSLEVSEFFKERELASRIINSMEERGIREEVPSAEEIVNAIIESEDFWAKMKEVCKRRK